MAALSSKKTGSTLSSWDHYIEGGKAGWERFSKTSILHDLKGLAYPFTDKDGKKISNRGFSPKTPLVITSPKSISIQGIQCAEIKISNVAGFLPISRIQKATTKDPLLKERMTIQGMDNALKQFIPKNSPKGITVIIPHSNSQLNKIEYVFPDIRGVVNVKGTPKADFALVDSKGIEQVFISHKDGAGPNAFQQYSGTSPNAGLVIHNHPEVQTFFKKLTNYISEIEKGQRYRSTVIDPLLINYAVYGPDYTSNNKKFGINHVHFIGQGNPILSEYKGSDKKLQGSYVLTFSHSLHTSGSTTEFITGGYKAVIGARKASFDRIFTVDNKIYRGVRILISPTASISVSTIKDI